MKVTHEVEKQAEEEVPEQAAEKPITPLRPPETPYPTAAETPEKVYNTDPIDTPCTVTITRPKNIMGAVMGVTILLNGNNIGVLKNGKMLSSSTSVEVNELQAIYEDGFSNSITFNSKPGKTVFISLKYLGAVLKII